MEPPHSAPSISWTRAAAIGLAIGAIFVALVVSALRARSDATVVLNVVEAPDPATIRVYVGGEVQSPGIYTLARGSRVAEAIDAAGGKTRGGDAALLQMATTLRDGDQVIVPEAKPTPRPATSATAASVAIPGASTIDINRATAAELEALPEIGPKLAERIVEYRVTNGPFTAVDQLAEIRGISERMVEALRPLVTVGP